MDAVITGERVRAIRLGLGLTQRELALRLGLTRTYVGLLERGHKSITERTRLAIEALRPSPLGREPQSTDPMLRELEAALIENGVAFETEYETDGQRFDFFIPELELAICSRREHEDPPKPIAGIRGVITATGKNAMAVLLLMLRGRPLRAARPIETPLSR